MLHYWAMDMTLSAQARETGLSLAHISKIYKGTRKPSFDAAVKIADARDITLEALYKELATRRKAMRRGRGKAA